MGELCELLKRMEDFLTRVEQCAHHKGRGATEGILRAWGRKAKPSETPRTETVGTHLLELLNSYVPGELRDLSLRCLTSMVRLLDSEPYFITKCIHMISRAHKRWNGGYNPNPGPYFPKRGHVTDPSMKIHPPQPALDMCLHQLQLEASKGVDAAYDSELFNYFYPYHRLIDIIVRAAINTAKLDNVQCLLDIAGKIATEVVPLHLSLFPKMWLDIAEKHDMGQDMTRWLDGLYQCESFHAYLSLILTQEHASLVDPTIFAFFQRFFPKALECLPPDCKSTAFENVREVLREAVLVSNRPKPSSPSALQQLAWRVSGAMRVIRLLENYVKERMLDADDLLENCMLLLQGMNRLDTAECSDGVRVGLEKCEEEIRTTLALFEQLGCQVSMETERILEEEDQ